MNYRAYYKMYVRLDMPETFKFNKTHWLFIEGCWMAGIPTQDCALMLMGRTP